MIALGCLFARGDHAATCPRCRAAAAQDRAVRAIADAAAPPGLSARRVDAAFARAFAEPAVVPPRRWAARLLPAGLALAAATAAIAIVVLATRGNDAVTPGTPTSRSIAAGAKTTVGHGTVALSPDGVAWQTGPTEVYLLTGTVDVEVDPAPHAPFRVRTNGFVVDVLGTVFTVSADGVAVSRGAVRVSSPTGQVLVDRLEAGNHWSAHGETAVAPAPTPTPDDEIVMDPDPIGSPKPSAKKLVAAGRTQIGAGDFKAGRKTLEQALAANPSRGDRTDAEILIADTYRLQGDVDEAVKRYRAVADSDHKRGEYPLGLAAQLEAQRGHAKATRELWQQYLDRYPDGALADKARKATQ